MRFDLFVADRLKISRNKASELIKSGKIALNGEICDKASLEVDDGEIALFDEIYVGRGAVKLKGFLQNLSLNIANLNALDIGSSTGGFTQILLQNGVASVVCVDVGSDQLDANLRANKRVRIYENTDVRKFKSEVKFTLITCDVSFISLLEILPAIDTNANSGALIITLFKPQFEVGREAKRNKKGVVIDAKAISAARRKFELAAANLGWTLVYTLECELKGKEGNAEFFYAFNKK